VRWKDNTPVTSRFEKKVLDFKFFHPFYLPKTGCLDDKKCKENGKKEQPATFEPCTSQFQTLP
jgi:hypothetical protein